MILHKSILSPIALGLVLLSMVSAQDTSSWIGKRVVTKYQCAVKVGDRVVDDDSTPRIYTVIRAGGDRLWVVSGSVKGWLPANQVVPFDQAIDFYTQEIRANPSNATAYSRRGVIRWRKTEFDIAIADFGEAIRLDPNYEPAYRIRGWAWYTKNEYDKAIADFSEAIRLDPKNRSTYHGRGFVWYTKKEYDKAIADCNEAIRLDPKNGWTYNLRASAWDAKKEYNKSIADWNEAIRLVPKSPSATQEPGTRLVFQEGI